MAVNIGRNNMKRLILLVIAVFLVIGGSAIADIPDTTDGEIHACIKNIGGTAGVASTNTSNKTLKLDVFVRCVKEQ